MVQFVALQSHSYFKASVSCVGQDPCDQRRNSDSLQCKKDKSNPTRPCLSIYKRVLIGFIVWVNFMIELFEFTMLLHFLFYNYYRVTS